MTAKQIRTLITLLGAKVQDLDTFDMLKIKMVLTPNFIETHTEGYAELIELPNGQRAIMIFNMSGKFEIAIALPSSAEKKEMLRRRDAGLKILF